MKSGGATIRGPHGAKRARRKQIKGWRLFLRLGLVTAALFLPVCIFAQQTKPSEFQVKAAYIYNFAKFVTWSAQSSASTSGSFTICAFEQDPFGKILEASLAGKLVHGKPVTIRSVKKPTDIVGCQILSIDSDQDRNLREIFAAARDASVLTVSDLPDFSKRGGMIQFVLVDDRVRFEINIASAQSAHLDLASDLLKVATTVRKSVEPGG